MGSGIPVSVRFTPCVIHLHMESLPPLSYPLTGTGESFPSMPHPLVKRGSQHWGLHTRKHSTPSGAIFSIRHRLYGGMLLKLFQVIHSRYPSFYLILQPSLFDLIRPHKKASLLAPFLWLHYNGSVAALAASSVTPGDSTNFYFFGLINNPRAVPNASIREMAGLMWAPASAKMELSVYHDWKNLGYSPWILIHHNIHAHTIEFHLEGQPLGQPLFYQ